MSYHRRRILKQSAAQAMLLDASLQETFVIRFQTSVQSLRVEKVSPGLLYVFALLQDSAGGHSLNWGDDVQNAAGLNPAPNSLTVQCFIGTSDGVLQAIAPGTYYAGATL
jgi:hypothetical protein